MSTKPSVLLIWGSQTGNAKSIAADLKTVGEEEGFECDLKCMEDIKDRDAKFDGVSMVIIVCSTTGEGDPPDNASRLYRRLKSKKHGADHLAHIKYTVLGLGDTNYSDFCLVPKTFHKRMTELGATCFYDPAWADDGIGMDIEIEPWKEGLYDAMRKAVADGPTAAATAAAAGPTVGGGEGGDAPAATVDSAVAAAAAAAAVAAVPAAKAGPDTSKLKLPKLQPSFLDVLMLPSVSAEQYVAARLVSHEVLTTDDAVKRSIAVTIQTPEPTGYTPGDTFALSPPNNAAEVAALLARLNVDASTADARIAFRVEDGTKKRGAAVPKHLEEATSIRQCLYIYCDLRSILTKGNIRLLAEYATDLDEQAAMLLLCSRQGADDYRAKCETHELSVAGILTLFASCQPPIGRVLEILQPNHPRRYSAASSAMLDPCRVRFVLNVVEDGLTSNWLDQLGPSATRDEGVEAGGSSGAAGAAGAAAAIPAGTSVRAAAHIHQVGQSIVPIFLEANATKFNAPDDISHPIIMIGPGTGVAPFLGFLEHRRAQRAAHPSGAVGDSYLFFGCRHETRDFLCRKEVEAFVADGTLTHLKVAFSRDEGAEAKYVQDLMKPMGAELTELMVNGGATMYICGNSHAVTGGIDKAITDMLTAHSGLKPAEVTDTKISWKEMGRLRAEHFGH